MIESLLPREVEFDREAQLPITERFDIPQIAAARATTLAVESALRWGEDLPCGAVLLDGASVIGRGYANDRRLGEDLLHAEVYALADACMNQMMHGNTPGSLLVTFEPCGQCQEQITDIQPELSSVQYILGREELEDRGLVNVRKKVTSGAADQNGLTFEQIPEGPAARANRLLLDHVQRDTETGKVTVNRDGLLASYDDIRAELAYTSPFIDVCMRGLLVTSAHR